MAKKPCCDDMAHAMRDDKTISCPWCGEPMELRNRLLAWSRWADKLHLACEGVDSDDVCAEVVCLLARRPDKAN
jgi:hypothetical protein